jgi:hypothetical protein
VPDQFSWRDYPQIDTVERTVGRLKKFSEVALTLSEHNCPA